MQALEDWQQFCRQRMQRQNNSAWAPVAYFSQNTNSAEQKYHSFALEMLAIVRAIERFHVYLSG